MAWLIRAACCCSRGKIRARNEDNFFFDGTFLPEENNGLEKTLVLNGLLKKDRVLAVFDGMGGERYGHSAAYAAASGMNAHKAKEPEELIRQLNLQVFEKAQSLFTSRMGCTAAMLLFRNDRLTICNLGDSRIYRLRDGKLDQVSQDHTDEALLRQRGLSSKPRLTQHLGIDPEELYLVPHVIDDTLWFGDRYLICSDGLTDMVSLEQIAALLQKGSAATAAQALTQAALDGGGKDNITVIVCCIY